MVTIDTFHGNTWLRVYVVHNKAFVWSFRELPDYQQIVPFLGNLKRI